MTRHRRDAHGQAGRRQARTPDPAAARSRGALGEAARQRLGHNLQLLYASVLDQPLPDRFARLLDDLSRGIEAGPDTTDREGTR